MKKLVGLLLSLSIFLLFLGVYVGSVDLPPREITKSVIAGIKSALGSSSPPSSSYFTIIWKLRLPRVILAYLVGLSLASAGVASQALFKNPLADPYIIGISGGASVGAALGMIYAPRYVQVFAFFFAILSVYAVYRTAKVDGKIPVDTLLLAGIAFGFMTSAVTSYLVLSMGERAHLTYMWLMGSFNGRGWRDVGIVAVVAFPVLLFLMLRWRELNLLLLGEEGRTMGLEVNSFRKVIIALISMTTAVAVSSSGIIGFVGLMGPHIARLLVGPNHRRLVPIAALLGGIIMVSADLVVRVTARPTEIPVGIVTAMMGGPFFLYLLMKHKRGEIRL